MNWLPPHGLCLASDPWLILGLVGSDLAIALAYFLIPWALVCIQRRIGFRVPVKTTVGLTFVVFIIGCGLTHLMRAVTMYVGGNAYYAELAVCVATVLASFTSLWVLVKAVPVIALQLRAMGHALEELDKDG